MSEECTHDCSTCGANCASRQNERESLIAPPNGDSRIKKVIGIVSGKGGVGKSLVTSLLAVSMNRAGKKTAILDADITGPSIPRIFGVKGPVSGDERGIFPAESKGGVKIISVNLFLDKDETPVLWRGPIIAGTVKQFWSDVFWDDVDYMFVDMPPGTGDVALTVFQSLPLDGIIVVSSPQELVNMIVAKAVNMANMMNVPVLGLVENMAYVKCPDCGKEIPVFGESHVTAASETFGIPVISRIPLDPALPGLCDKGQIELCADGLCEGAVKALLEI
ncbi:MAG: Mrp/NBP35 family ATP-binding protein [Clostridia bacterium]|nr:Mrp/NBP35 family ATP-binding protein [Clostridia bacterium]